MPAYKNKKGYEAKQTTRVRNGKKETTTVWVKTPDGGQAAKKKPSTNTKLGKGKVSAGNEKQGTETAYQKYVSRNLELPRPVDNYESVRLPAGKYWVGDPCYAFENDNDWDEVLSSSDFFNDTSRGETRSGDVVYAWSTAFGDGLYPGSDGNNYPVDAGLIGVMPARPGEPTPGGMEEHVYDAPFTAHAEDGEFHFGGLKIRTGDYMVMCDDCGEEYDEEDGHDDCPYKECERCGNAYPDAVFSDYEDICTDCLYEGEEDDYPDYDEEDDEEDDD